MDFGFHYRAAQVSFCCLCRRWSRFHHTSAFLFDLPNDRLLRSTTWVSFLTRLPWEHCQSPPRLWALVEEITLCSPKSNWQVPEGSSTRHWFINHSIGSPSVSAWILSFFSLLELSKQSWAFSFIRSVFTVLRFEDSKVLWLTPSGHSKNKNKTPQWGIFLLLRPTSVEQPVGEPWETVDAFKSRHKTHPFNSAFKCFSLHSS